MLGAEQLVHDEPVQPTAACVADVPGLQQVQTAGQRLGGSGGGGLGVETPLLSCSWITMCFALSPLPALPPLLLLCAR